MALVWVNWNPGVRLLARFVLERVSGSAILVVLTALVSEVAIGYASFQG